jgi:hypothetical protein
MNSSGGAIRRSTWRTTAIIFAVAVAFNYVWELAQAPLYAGMNDFRQMLWHCIVPSLGDGVLVLLIFALGWIVLRRRDWFVRPGGRGYGLMLSAGLVIAICIELVTVYALGRWEYTTQMPILPGLGVGLAPIAQMLVLPPVIFRVVAAWCAPSQ